MRLFVALDLPWMLRERLSMLAGSGLPGARWVPPENYHLTLRFIGETPGHRAEDIDDALSGLRARGFPLTLERSGILSWTTCRPRLRQRCSAADLSLSDDGFSRT